MVVSKKSEGGNVENMPKLDGGVHEVICRFSYFAGVHAAELFTVGNTHYGGTCQTEHLMCRLFAKTKSAASCIGRTTTCVRRTTLCHTTNV